MNEIKEGGLKLRNNNGEWVHEDNVYIVSKETARVLEEMAERYGEVLSRQTCAGLTWFYRHEVEPLAARSKEKEPALIAEEYRLFIEQSKNDFIQTLRAARRGDTYAQDHLGFCYAYGLGTEIDMWEAARWYRRAAKEGDTASQIHLADCYHEEGGVLRSDWKAIKWFSIAAEYGSEEAKDALEFFGNVVDVHNWESNNNDAIKNFLQSAEQGNANSQTALGQCFYDGYGVRQSFKKAVYWFRKAAMQNEIDAQLMLAACYENGEGVKRNTKQAAKWLIKALTQLKNIDRETLYEIVSAECADRDKDIWQTYYFNKEAQAYLHAAMEGDSEAQFNIARHYCYGLGVEQDYKATIYWLRKSAEQGNKFAEMKLGNMYAYGKGVQRSIKQAAKWWLKAAEQGYSRAQYNIGVCYHYGKGVAQNFEKAAQWYLRAAEQDLAEAQFGISECYDRGEGVPQDPVAAQMWSTRAVENIKSR